MIKLPILLVPEKVDPERDKVLETWIDRGGNIQRLGKYWIKDENFTNESLAIYGNQTFALVLAQIYDLSLISPNDSLIAELEKRWTKRTIHLKLISDLVNADFPVFIKPVIPKLFQAGVFKTIDDFRTNSKGIADNEEILLSEIVGIDSEARSFILGNDIKDIAIYEGTADVREARAFLNDFIEAGIDGLPKTVVIDLAFNRSIGWFILEFNACWGAGLNGCDAEKVIDCIINATESNLDQIERMNT